jgi:hypothetical protein
MCKGWFSVNQIPAFIWETKEQSNKIFINNRTYQISIKPVQEHFTVELFEDNFVIERIHTTNSSFKSTVDSNSPLKEQILQWAKYILEETIQVCECCKEKKYTKELADYDKKEPEFQAYKRLCPQCRTEIYNKMFNDMKESKKIEDEAIKKEYEKNPPTIAGGFKSEGAANRILRIYSNPDIEDVGDGFVVAKGILKANDGTFYPVFLHICVQDGGELYGTDFIDTKHNRLIPQQFILPYINKEKDAIFPYKYKTISQIPGDFHQSNWPDFS